MQAKRAAKLAGEARLLACWPRDKLIAKTCILSLHQYKSKKTSGQFGDCIPKQIIDNSYMDSRKLFSDRYRPHIFMVGWQKDGRNIQHAVTSSDRSASTSSLSEQFLLTEPMSSSYTTVHTLLSPEKQQKRVYRKNIFLNERTCRDGIPKSN